MAETRKILWRFLGDSKSLEGASRKSTQSLSGVTKAVGALGLAMGAREVLQFADDAVQLAVAAEEVDSKFEAVFGSAGELRGELSALGDVAGITDTDIFDLPATFGNLAMAQGLTKDDTEELTVKVGELAADMASFNDADPQIVFEDLNKALLTTEREGLEKFGTAVSEAEVKSGALAIAVADGRENVTQADRAMASYELVVRKAGKAVGDLDRTSDSLANRQRQVKAEIDELQTEIGKELLPAYQDMIGAVADLTPVLKEGVGLIGDTTEGIELLTDAVSGISDPFGDAEAAARKTTEEYASQAIALVKTLNPAMWALDEVIGSVGHNLGDLAPKSSDAAEAQWALSQGAHAAKEELRQQSELGEPYLEFARGMRLWADSMLGSMNDVDSAAAEFDRKLGLFTGDLFARAREARTAGEQYAAALLLFTGGGGSGQVADEVEIDQAVSDALTRFEEANGTRFGGVSTP